MVKLAGDQFTQVVLLAQSADSAKLIAESLYDLYGDLTSALTIHDSEFRWPKTKTINTQIITGTPSTTRDYSKNYKCFDLSDIKVLIVDEVDTFVKVQNCQDDTIRIARELSAGCKVFLFSEINETNQMDVQNFAERLQGCNINIQVSIQSVRFLTYIT
ncbi:ATP-dependent RNA helicase DDX25-like [Ptychodera flava]|uniref:ATP-dependent RNA helicase DDX25-like n=1 Tax=Ptychodera flava TaxID=63121 RepID=UPI00396A0CBD